MNTSFSAMPARGAADALGKEKLPNASVNGASTLPVYPVSVDKTGQLFTIALDDAVRASLLATMMDNEILEIRSMGVEERYQGRRLSYALLAKLVDQFRWKSDLQIYFRLEETNLAAFQTAWNQLRSTTDVVDPTEMHIQALRNTPIFKGLQRAGVGRIVSVEVHPLQDPRDVRVTMAK